MKRFAGVVQDRHFRLLWAGQAISQSGSIVTRMALPLTALFVLNASPAQMGWMGGISSGAIFGFGLFAGAWVDRLRRRPLMIAADVGRTLLLGSIPLAAALHTLSMTQLYVVSALAAALTVLFDVSYRAYLPSILKTDRLIEANSKISMTESVAEFTIPGLAGMLVAWITAPMAILVDAVSFAFSAYSISEISAPEPAPARSSNVHMGIEIRDGLLATWRDPILRTLLARRVSASFFLGFFSSLYFLFAARDLGIGVPLLGAIISVGGASAIGGSLLAERLTHRIGVGNSIVVSSIAIGIASLLPSLARGPAVVCAVVLIAAQLCDAAWPIFTISETSLIQTITPHDLQGRVNAAMHQMFNGMLPLGALAGGWLAEMLDVRTAMFIGGAGVLVSNAALLLSPIRGLRVASVAAE